jgi:nitrogen fixation NifU-like protein
MFSATLLDYFQRPRNPGSLPPPAVTVIVENPACGDVLHLSALVEGGRIARTGFLVRGCTASIAAASALTEMLLGLEVADLTGVTAAQVEERLDGLPEASRHAAVLCADGVRALQRQLPKAS